MDFLKKHFRKAAFITAGMIAGDVLYHAFMDAAQPTTPEIILSAAVLTPFAITAGYIASALTAK